MDQRGGRANGRLIKALRADAGWSQQQLADQARVDKATVSRAEHGAVLNHRNLKRIADALKVPVKKLIQEGEEPLEQGRPLAGQFSIANFPNGYKPPAAERVFGCRMTYLEHATRGRDLVVLLPGLGLDADSFRQYVTMARLHVMAVTLPGFELPHSLCSETLSLNTYIQVIIAWLHSLHGSYPKKDLHVVGFSIGADMLLWVLKELSRSEQALCIRSVLLLDCNIDQRTMTISKALSDLSEDSPLECFKSVINGSRDMVELFHRIRYLETIYRKDLHRVRKLATEVVQRWPERDVTVFWKNVAGIGEFPRLVRLVFSSDNGPIITELMNARPAVLRPNVMIEPDHRQHFDLVQPDVLEQLIASTLEKSKFSTSIQRRAKTSRV